MIFVKAGVEQANIQMKHIKLKGSYKGLCCDSNLMWMGQVPGWMCVHVGGFLYQRGNSAVVTLAAVSGKGDSLSLTTNRKHSDRAYNHHKA